MGPDTDEARSADRGFVVGVRVRLEKKKEGAVRKLLSVGGALATALGPGEEAFKRGSYAFPFTGRALNRRLCTPSSSAHCPWHDTARHGHGTADTEAPSLQLPVCNTHS
jgi:hypothetical protein